MEAIRSRNNVRILGKGEQVILFAHGFGCEQSMWKWITPYFEQHYKLVLFDYVGAGNSDLTAYTDRYHTIQGYVDDILMIIEQYKLENILFVGHSVSSMIGLLASIERPDAFKKLIMIGPSPCYMNDGDYAGGFNEEDIRELLQMMEMNFSGWASHMAPFALGESATTEHTETLKNVFVSQNPKMAREFAEVTFHLDCRHRLHEVTVPSLILQCADDSIVPIEVGKYLAKHLPQSCIVILEAKGHYPHISHAEELVEHIRMFIGED